MAILEKIRKRTTVLILIIGLALFAFVVSGVFTSNEFSGGTQGSTVAEVNGEAMGIDVFRAAMENATRSYGANFASSQLLTLVYNQELRKRILEQQYNRLGIAVQGDQVVDFVQNSVYAQIPDFQDENGVFNEAVFKNTLAAWKLNDPLRYDTWLQEEEAIVQAAKEQHYFNLVKAGIHASYTEGKFQYHSINDKVDLEYVHIPYTSIPDSTIAVSTQDVEAYIKAHRKAFQQEEARNLRFVFFEEKPTAKDEKAVEEAITALLDDSVVYTEATATTDTLLGFRNTPDVAAFLDRYSDTAFDTLYKTQSELPAAVADALMQLREGTLYGPYRDGAFFKVSRLMDKKRNGAVKASHILVAYAGAERANPNISRTANEARAKAQELLAKAQSGNTAFAALARENSDGPSATQGGDLGYFTAGVMAEAFNDFCFQNSVGSIGLVETPFGFHVIRIEDKQDALQLATLSRVVETSEETLNALFTQATQFEMTAAAADPEAFNALAQEGGYSAQPINQLKAMDANLPGLGDQRSIVQWAFNADTEVGDLRRFSINNGYAVVQLTQKYDEGLIPAEEAATRVIPKIRTARKAEQIIKANAQKTMQALATDNKLTVKSASDLTLASPVIPGAGREPLVVGTAFGLEEGESTALVQGESGVFKAKVTQKEVTSDREDYGSYATTLRNRATSRVNQAVYNALKEGADIEDKRAMFY